MQLYARDNQQQVIFVQHAQRQYDYFCLECQQTVRIRGGFHRQLHFYHLSATQFCRQNGKSIEHLQVQYFLQKQIPTLDCQLEKSFPTIQRIADVAWLSKKIIFEVQCSPISQRELLARIQDYHSIGWTCVWILHDSQFNQLRICAAEKTLQSYTHYFTNIDAQGIGFIYDQWQQLEIQRRKHTIKPFSVQVDSPYSWTSTQSTILKKTTPYLHSTRISWQIHFANDLCDQILQQIKVAHQQPLIMQVLAQEQLWQTNNRSWSYALQFLLWPIQKIYQYYYIIFQIILEKSSH